MAFKLIVLCASALFVQAINAQCINNVAGLAAGYGLANNGLAGNLLGNPGYGMAYGSNVPTSGGGLVVTSTSPIAPTGLQVLAEMVIEGPLSVGGQLPLLATVALEGAVPTGGQAGASYGCGNGNIGIVSEIGNGAAVGGIGAGLNGIGAGLNGIGAGLNGIGAGLNGIGAGYGGIGAGLNGIGSVGCGRIL